MKWTIGYFKSSITSLLVSSLCIWCVILISSLATRIAISTAQRPLEGIEFLSIATFPIMIITLFIIWPVIELRFFKRFFNRYNDSNTKLLFSSPLRHTFNIITLPLFWVSNLFSGGIVTKIYGDIGLDYFITIPWLMFTLLTSIIFLLFRYMTLRLILYIYTLQR
jgi:hypothetical protein